MQPEIAAQLLEINRRFYHEFGASFASTRRRIQPGVRRIVQRLPKDGKWLDLGCGNGALAVEWAHQGHSGLYIGMDFSTPLLEEALHAIQAISHPQLKMHLLAVDFSQPENLLPTAQAFCQEGFDGALMFATLHHLPTETLRRRLLLNIHTLLKPNGVFIHSVWQFQNSPKIWARRVLWETVGLNPADLEAGDTLLDWRHTLPGESPRSGLRYVHLFSEEELRTLATDCGFTIAEQFLSDGQSGNLGLYQVWHKTS
ncbi:MAG: class I SAM-dependent methyltransferase [Anaerolineae bacterium]|nr:class I SAM-dependent methyltransferase [Anaerolineae bacterium]